MNENHSNRIELTILGDRYPIRTPSTLADAKRVRNAASMLNERIENIATTTKELSSLRLAVMAGLDIACELVAERDNRECHLADEAAFRKNLRQRTARLMELVREEMTERSATD